MNLKLDKQKIKSITKRVLTEYYLDKAKPDNGLTDQDREMFSRIFNNPSDGEAYFQYHKFGRIINETCC